MFNGRLRAKWMNCCASMKDFPHLDKYGLFLQNGHTAHSIARQLGRPAILGALKRSSRLDDNQPLQD